MSAESTGIAVTVTNKDGDELIGKIQDSAEGTIDPGFEAEAPDQDGAVYDTARGDWRATMDITMIADSTDTLPGRDEHVEIAGFQNTSLNGIYEVNSVGETQNAQSHAQRSYSVIRYLDNSYPSSLTTTTTTTT